MTTVLIFLAAGFIAVLLYKLSEATPKVGDAATVPKRALKAVSLNDLLDELDRRQKDNAADAYATRTFSLSRDKGATLSLGPCPGEKCIEFELGELHNTEEGLEQEIILKGDIGIKFNPKPGMLFQMDAMLQGARLVPGKEQSSAWFLLRPGGGFRLSTHRADVIFTVLDVRADNLKVKLELKPSSLTERRKTRPAPPAPKHIEDSPP